MKKLALVLILLCLVIRPLFAADGKLNVVTGIHDAKIFIDGKFVAQDYVNDYVLQDGDHYVRIENEGKLMYAQMVHIYSSEVRTITSENFVDIKTDVANRGAIDREAKRLRETKGSLGLGFVYGYNLPASGLSVKWILFEPVGAQVSAFGGTLNGVSHTQYGARLIWVVGNKILGDSALTGYVAPGIAIETEGSGAGQINSTNMGTNMGLEWAPFDPVYLSAEIGAVYKLQTPAAATPIQFSGSLGLHVFF